MRILRSRHGPRDMTRPPSSRGRTYGAWQSSGILGLGVEEEYGGSGGTTRQLVVAVEEIARACAATATVLGAHLSLCTQYIQMFGTEGQKREFIPPLVDGTKIGAFALTEPGSGSDAAAMQTTGTRSNGGYLLNGTKTFITNAEESSTMVVMATQDRSLGARGVNTFIVERDSPGITINPLHGKDGDQGVIGCGGGV